MKHNSTFKNQDIEQHVQFVTFNMCWTKEPMHANRKKMEGLKENEKNANLGRVMVTGWMDKDR